MIVLEYAAYGDLLSHLKGKMMITQYAQLQFQNQSSTTFNDNSNAIVENASTSSYMRPTVPSEDDGGTETPSQTPEVGNNMIDIKTLLSIAWQVAKGMNHLAQMKVKIFSSVIVCGLSDQIATYLRESLIAFLEKFHLRHGLLKGTGVR